jgi:uncharacterized protein YbaA (DUF1428 family)
MNNKLSDLHKLVNPHSPYALNRVIKNFNFPQDRLAKEYSKITKAVNIHTYKPFDIRKALFTNFCDFENVVSTYKQAALVNKDFSRTSKLLKQITEIQNFYKNTQNLLPAFDNINTNWDFLNNSGLTSSLSNICKNMTAIQVIEKLNKYLPYIKDFVNDVSISDDNTITFNGETLTNKEIKDITQEFITKPIKKSKASSTTAKSNKRSILIAFICFLIFDILFAPVFQETYQAIRDYTRITKLIKKIKIRSWIDDFVKNHIQFLVIKDEELQSDNKEDINKE